MRAFDDPVLREQLMKSLTAWEGTPYRHCTMVKGRAADCVMFIGESMKDAGVIQKYDFERYSVDWYLHLNNELLLEWLEKNFGNIKGQYRFEFIEPEDPLFGDILLFEMIEGRPIQHIAICGDNNRMWHANVARGVCWTKFGPAWRKRLKKIGRIWLTLES